MKIIIAPDKFKGSLSSIQACEAMQAGILKIMPQADIQLFPMADGGDGFDEVLKYYLRTKTIYCKTVDPLLRPITAAYQLNASTGNAIIALSAASGLVLLSDEERDPLLTSTYGTGIMIKHAVENDAKKIILGLGGSATNDAGLGILSALGFKLFDDNAKELSPIGKNVELVHKITPPSKLLQIEFQIACDVRNFLFGPEGAAFVYAPQKGADEETVQQLDQGLQHIAKLFYRQKEIDVSTVPGAGAAGGVAAGIMTYFNCSIVSGANKIINESGITESIKGADLVLTGEGKLDAQSLSGKVIDHIIKVAKQYDKPVIALCGVSELNSNDIEEAGLTTVHQILNDNITIQESMTKAESLLINESAFAFKQYLNN